MTDSGEIAVAIYFLTWTVSTIALVCSIYLEWWGLTIVAVGTGFGALLNLRVQK